MEKYEQKSWRIPGQLMVKYEQTSLRNPGQVMEKYEQNILGKSWATHGKI